MPFLLVPTHSHSRGTSLSRWGQLVYREFTDASCQEQSPPWGCPSQQCLSRGISCHMGKTDTSLEPRSKVQGGTDCLQSGKEGVDKEFLPPGNKVNSSAASLPSYYNQLHPVWDLPPCLCSQPLLPRKAWRCLSTAVLHVPQLAFSSHSQAIKP